MIGAGVSIVSVGTDSPWSSRIDLDKEKGRQRVRCWTGTSKGIGVGSELAII